MLGIFRDIGDRGGEAEALNEAGMLHWACDGLRQAGSCYLAQFGLENTFWGPQDGVDLPGKDHTVPAPTSDPLTPDSSRQRAYGRPRTVGDQISARALQGLDGRMIQVPDGKNLVHLQLRRFAGCPICNLHLRSVVQRKDEIALAGIHEVVVFHSTREELRHYAADLPLDTVADPGRELYREFGVERSASAVLNPRLWPRFPRIMFTALRSALRGRGLPPLRPNGGLLGRPADILMSPGGRVVAVKYGAHAYDQWSVDELLACAKAASASERAAS